MFEIDRRTRIDEEMDECAWFASKASVSDRLVQTCAHARAHTQVTIRPEMPLASLLGIWGAAFTASTSEVVRSLTGKSCVPPSRGGGGITGFGRAERSDQTPTVRNRHVDLAWPRDACVCHCQSACMHTHTCRRSWLVHDD